MHDPDNNPETLISVPSDLEAAMIVSALAAHGVDASTSGEFTAGFRAEAPGMVKVLVRRVDLTRARGVLEGLESDSPSKAAGELQTATTLKIQGIDTKKLLTIAILILLAIGILQSCF